MGLTQARLQEVVRYDAVTGVFYWRPRFNLRHVARDGRAGSRATHGYRYLLIDGHKYKASKLAWLYSYGQWPEKPLDHINGTRDDDRLCNLREATIAENNQNHGPHKNNSSGFRGVRFERGKWRAQIRVNGRSNHIGMFGSPEEASQAYLAARAIAFPFQPIPREC